jgi:signal transduction histidine kinase
VYFTTLLAVIGGLALGFGLLFVLVGLRRATDRRLNVTFGLMALAYAGWAVSARAGYLASDVAGLVAAGRSTAVFASLSFALMLWFVAIYADARWRLPIYAITGLFAVIGLASLALPIDLLIAPPIEISATTLPWGETVQTVEASGAALIPFAIGSRLAFTIYVVWAVVALARRRSTHRAVVLGIGVGWFIALSTGDILVSTDVIDFVYLFGFGFLGFVVTISIDTANRGIETEKELRLLQAGLENEVAERTAHLEAVQAKLVVKTAEEATLAERGRLARELHDAVTQTLFSLNLIAGTLGRLWRTDRQAAERSTDEVQRLARGALAEMRVLLRELRPQALAETDLDTLVSQLSEGLGARYDVPVKVHAAVGRSLPEDVHLAFYRIAQEAMQNAGKHADASQLTIDLTGDNGEVRLVVTDDGVGFDPVDETEWSMGLRIMQERADTIGAGLSVASSPGAGTSVAITWPPPERNRPV